MKTESIFELAKLAKEKGFTTQTVTTDWTNNYLLNKGKDMFINSMCFYLWLCELSKWLRDTHNIYVDVMEYYNEKNLPLENKKFPKPEGYIVWDKYSEDFTEEDTMKFETMESALEFGCEYGLKLIKNN